MLFRYSNCLFFFFILFFSLVNVTSASITFSKAFISPEFCDNTYETEGEILDLRYEEEAPNISISENYLNYRDFKVKLPEHDSCEPIFIDEEASFIFGLIDNDIFLARKSDTGKLSFHKAGMQFQDIVELDSVSKISKREYIVYFSVNSTECYYIKVQLNAEVRSNNRSNRRKKKATSTSNRGGSSYQKNLNRQREIIECPLCENEKHLIFTKTIQGKKQFYCPKRYSTLKQNNGEFTKKSQRIIQRRKGVSLETFKSIRDSWIKIYEETIELPLPKCF